MSAQAGAGLAPIALFAFKRPAHLQRTLEALAANPGFAGSPLYIYCDAARRPDEAALVEEARAVARRWSHAMKTVVEAQSNQGLARSVIGGVSQLCNQYGRVIVVEDDLRVAPAFLTYMNLALNRYSSSSNVMQISGHMFSVELQAETDAVFLPLVTSWGWATWSRAWKLFDPDMKAFDEVACNRQVRNRFDIDGAFPYFSMLKRQRQGLIDSWAVRWYLSVFMCGGIVLYPKRSLVINDGFDGSGTHGAVGSPTAKSQATSHATFIDAGRLPEPQVDEAAFIAVKALLRRENSPGQRLLRKLRAKFA